MSLFTTRVELHSATSKDYETLHAEMKKEGFWLTIRLDSEKVSYHLPTAEYNYGSTSDNSIESEQVLELAKKAANRTGKKFSVLVTKVAERRYWYNLEPVK